MKTSVLTGDTSIFNRVSSISTRDFFPVIQDAAYCWEFYGLPDGTNNSIRNTPPGCGHGTRPPTEDEINESFNKVLSGMLQEEEKWLLRIPRRIANLNTLDARTYCSSNGGAAVVFPYGAFGGLFLVHEVHHDLQAGDKGRLSEKSRAYLSANFHTFLAYWILCKGELEKFASDVELELVALRFMRPASERTCIWLTAVTQQVFILLHEFGHLLQLDPKCKKEVSTDLYSFEFSGCEEEIKADQWAARRLQAGFSSRFGRDFQSVLPIIELFGLMEILRQHGHLKVERDQLVERLYRLVQQLNPQMEGHLSEVWVESLLSDFECYLLK